MTHRPDLSPSRLVLLLALALLLPLAGCGDDEPVSVMEAEPAPEEAVAGDDAAAGGSPIGPISSRSGQGAARAPSPGAAPTAGSGGGAGIRWDWPDRWQLETPDNRMRMAQASIPGDAGAASFVVFHFGPGGGGGVDANIDRWVGQMEVDGEPDRETYEVGDFRVTRVEVAGTLKPSTMGMGPSEPQPDSRLIGAVVEGAGGPWFFKATGPDATLAAAREEIRDLLESIEPAG